MTTENRVLVRECREYIDNPQAFQRCSSCQITVSEFVLIREENAVTSVQEATTM
jgi:hypothetical protein